VITVRGRARIYASLVAAFAIGLLTVACSSHPQTPAQASASASAARAAASASVPAAMLARDLKITPANGSHGVDPSAGVTVTTLEGKVTNVTVTPASGGGGAVSGTLADGGRVWHSTWALHT
jgi:hypothetical protein